MMARRRKIKSIGEMGLTLLAIGSGALPICPASC